MWNINFESGYTARMSNTIDGGNASFKRCWKINITGNNVVQVRIDFFRVYLISSLKTTTTTTSIRMGKRNYLPRLAYLS